MRATLLRQAQKVPVARVTPPHPVPSGEAFALVKKLLEERPRHFREILFDGVGASSKQGQAGPSKKGKGKDVSAENLVPENHPFVSGTFLKKHILNILESQSLIQKEWRPAQPGSIIARGHSDKKHAMWALRTDGERADRWQRLLGDVDEALLSQLGHEVQLERSAEVAAVKEAAFESGEAERSERDIWAWDGRPQGITTPLERKHMSVRRSRARVEKEARRAEHESERLAAKAAAEEAVRQGSL